MTKKLLEENAFEGMARGEVQKLINVFVFNYHYAVQLEKVSLNFHNQKKNLPTYVFFKVIKSRGMDDEIEMIEGSVEDLHQMKVCQYS